jgi:hypothetical protein
LPRPAIWARERRQLLANLDPIEQRRQAQQAAMAQEMVTFAQAVERDARQPQSGDRQAQKTLIRVLYGRVVTGKYRCAASRRASTVRLRPRRTGSAWLAQEEGRRKVGS